VAKRKKKARKRVKARREEGKDYVYKESGAKGPTYPAWQKFFLAAHGIETEQTEDGRIRVPQREVLHVKPAPRKKKNSEEKT